MFPIAEYAFLSDCEVNALIAPSGLWITHVCVSHLALMNAAGTAHTSASVGWAAEVSGRRAYSARAPTAEATTIWAVLKSVS